MKELTQSEIDSVSGGFFSCGIIDPCKTSSCVSKVFEGIGAIISVKVGIINGICQGIASKFGKWGC